MTARERRLEPPDRTERGGGTSKAHPLQHGLRTAAAVGILAVIALAVAAPPWSVLDKAHLIGYGICHQIPERTFFLNGKPLPLCARCSGTYLGVALGLLGLAVRGRWRCGALPRGLHLIPLAAFIGFWGIDGMNSYLSFFPQLPHLYPPSNLLRVSTGMLNGLALSLVVYPVFNHTLWRRTLPIRSIERLEELLPFFAPMALLIWGMESGAGYLLYPVALISTGAVLTLLTMVNTMILIILFAHESFAESWADAWLPVGGGLVLSLLELSAMITVRAILTQTMSLPF